MTLDRFKKVPIPYTRIRELKVWTLSNFLSVLRVLLLPFIYLSLFRQTGRGDEVAVALMAGAALTDILDGWMARFRRTISSFGKIIDPLADKICMVSIAIFLITLRGFPVWLFLFMVVREVVIIVSGALLIRRYKIVFPANIWGKIYSFSVALLIAGFTLRYGREVILPLESLVIALALFSFLSYSVITLRYMRTHHRHQRTGRLHKAADPHDGAPGNEQASTPPAVEGPTTRR